MRKAFRIIISIHLCIFILICGAKFVYRRARTRDLLQHAGISDAIRVRQKDYTYWKDFLMYVNGYEVLALKVDPEKWMMPEGWSGGPIAVDDLETKTEFSVNELVINGLNADIPETFDAWFFAECGREGEFADWEYYIGLYSGKGLLIVYRGHDLNSDLWMRPYDGEDIPWSD